MTHFQYAIVLARVSVRLNCKCPCLIPPPPSLARSPACLLASASGDIRRDLAFKSCREDEHGKWCRCLLQLWFYWSVNSGNGRILVIFIIWPPLEDRQTDRQTPNNEHVITRVDMEIRYLLPMEERERQTQNSPSVPKWGGIDIILVGSKQNQITCFRRWYRLPWFPCCNWKRACSITDKHTPRVSLDSATCLRINLW